jgi:hypothetical protein
MEVCFFTGVRLRGKSDLQAHPLEVISNAMAAPLNIRSMFTREPMAVDQILPDSHRVPVALQLKRDQFAIRLAAARRSATRLPGQKAGDHLDGRF